MAGRHRGPLLALLVIPPVAAALVAVAGTALASAGPQPGRVGRELAARSSWRDAGIGLAFGLGGAVSRLRVSGPGTRDGMNAQTSQSLHIPVEGAEVEADLVVPDAAWGTVLFAHGSGSSRHSPRNRQVAAVLQQAGLATVLADLLTADEERVDVRTGQFRFDAELLGARVATLVDWAVENLVTAGLGVGLFGASTGAAAALIAADQRSEQVAAVVSRGGRPDLAGDHLESVRAPTLLIVGQLDHQVAELNRQAMARMNAEVQLTIVPAATHLFEEPGALRQVSDLATGWFVRTLAPTGR